VKEIDYFEGLRDEGEMILKWILKKESGVLWDVGCIHVTLDRNKCCAFVNTVMTIGVQQRAENFSYIYGNSYSSKVS
jgi:hypothetical protein